MKGPKKSAHQARAEGVGIDLRNRSWGETSVSTASRRDIGKTNVPKKGGSPGQILKLKEGGKQFKDCVSPGDQSSRAQRRTSLVLQKWKAVKRNRTNWAPSTWAPRSLWPQ